MAASVDHVMLKEVENGIFRHNRIFRNNGCINNPWWQSGGIIIFFFQILHSFLRYTDRRLDVFFEWVECKCNL